MGGAPINSALLKKLGNFCGVKKSMAKKTRKMKAKSKGFQFSLKGFLKALNLKI